jgi:hypothetical protein
MKPGDLVQAEDKATFQTLWSGTGILIRHVEHGEWTISWEVLCADGRLRVIDGEDIVVVESHGWEDEYDTIMESAEAKALLPTPTKSKERWSD